MRQKNQISLPRREACKRLASCLRHMQISSGMSTNEACAKAGVSRTTWYRWVSGRSSIPTTKFKHLMRVFNFRMSQIVGLSVSSTVIPSSKFVAEIDAFNKYISYGDTYRALGVLRAVGHEVFDILCARGFAVDMILSNRIKDHLSGVNIYMHTFTRKYNLSLFGTHGIEYKFCETTSQEVEVLHEGFFCSSVFKAIAS